MSDPASAVNFALPGDPVFIVGYPRSGTTLLQALLSTFPRFFSFPETHFFNVIEQKLATNREGCLSPSGIAAGVDAIFDKTGVRFEPAAVEDLKKRCDGGCISSREIFEILVGILLRKQHPGESFAEPFRWVEKTPNHAYFLEEIAAAYPDALFVNILRHPVAAVSSRRKAFAANRETPAAELARLWNRSVESAEEFAGRHPRRLHSLLYEDLVTDPKKQMTAVAAFLGVDFNPVDLDSFSKHGQGLRHEWETWKNGVGHEGTFDGNASHFAAVPLTELLVTQRECREGMARWGYRPRHPLRQAIYTLTGWPGPGARKTS